MRIVQAWGMTETSPLAAVVAPAARRRARHRPRRWTGGRAPGRVVAGVELRIVDDDGDVLPWDGEAVGEIEVAGRGSPASYYGDPAPEKFDDGWLRTGDVASVTPQRLRADHRPRQGRHQVGRRVDLARSSSRATLMAHPDVVEAARDRRARPAVGRAAARVRRAASEGVDVDAARARATFLGDARRQVAAARAVDVHRRGAEDERRQVRQEGAARAVRRRRARRGGAR